MKVKELSEICKKSDCRKCLVETECDKFSELRKNFLPCATIPENVKENHRIMEVEIPE